MGLGEPRHRRGRRSRAVQGEREELLIGGRTLTSTQHAPGASSGAQATRRTWRRSFAAQQAEFYVFRLPRTVPVLHGVFRRLFVADLRRLNDVLAQTALSGHYWLWGGILLGWAREGRVLPHDDMDADFAVLEDDWPLLEQAVPALELAGYRGVRRFVDHDGQVTERSFMRHGARFDFFKLSAVGDTARYTVYGRHDGAYVEVEEEVPLQPTEEISFLGRTWRKVRDHERELAVLYGDWRTPDRQWSYTAAASNEVGRRGWDPTSSHW